ncbi:MAG TPA: hypothetical protein PKB10_11455, partial [Tepidisphaeraceae bacterium]|nr:hypothetical protein [Tepidisphaeraceae bacterium]
LRESSAPRRGRSPAGDRGRFNGLILRLGRERTDFPELAVGERAFELAPGFEWIPAGDPDGNNSARNAIPTLPMPTGSWNNVVVNNATPYVPNAGSAAWPRGFVVGRAITNYQITSPYQPTFTGAAQDIACYTTIIPVN